MMVNTSIDTGAAPVSYLNEDYLVARDRSDGMSSIVYREVTGRAITDHSNLASNRRVTNVMSL